MLDLVLPRFGRGTLDVRAVLRQAFRLQRRLLGKTLPVAFLVFAVLEAAPALAFGHVPDAVLAALMLVATLAGAALVQGALAELVWDQHQDGEVETSLVEVARRWFDRSAELLGAALFAACGLALAPSGVVAVPVLVLEDMPLRPALRRSREAVGQNELPVFAVLACAAGAVLAAQTPLPLLAGLAGNAVGFWLASTVAAAVTAPYLAHVGVVAYFALTQPTRPIVLDPGERWNSVRADQPYRPEA